MFKVRLLLAILGCGSLCGVALAQPSVHAVGTPNGGNVDWEVFIQADPFFFTQTTVGYGGSMAAELSLEFFGDIISEPVVAAFDWDYLNPGDNPHTGSVTNGVHRYEDVPSTVVIGPSNVDAIYLSLGSRVFYNNAPNLAVSFSTAGSSGELFWGGEIAQQGGFNNFVNGSQVSDSPVIYLAGDANKDGVVSGGDLLSVTQNFGSIGPPDGALLGDADGDGFVKGSDLLSVTENFGTVLEGPALGGPGNPGEPSLGDVAAVGVGVPGDYDFDGEVKLYDYPVWRDTLGSNVDLRADGNFNNFIDEFDYDVWASNYGSGAFLESGTPVPEPAAGLLLMATLLGFAAKRKRS